MSYSSIHQFDGNDNQALYPHDNKTILLSNGKEYKVEQHAIVKFYTVSVYDKETESFQFEKVIALEDDWPNVNIINAVEKEDYNHSFLFGDYEEDLE